MRSFIILLLLTSNALMAQHNHMAQFAIWKPKDGQAQNFENGYKQHLNWHKVNKDPWGWYGWYIISGPRYGQFVDATFNHSWTDFDHAIKPAEDMADNRLHVFPFGDVQSVYKVAYLPELSMADSASLKSKLLRLVTLDVSDIENGKKIIRKFKASIQPDTHDITFLTFKVVDGGNLNQLMLLIGSDNYEAYGISEGLQEDLMMIERSLKIKAIHSITSETLRYREDMSLFPD